MRLLLSLPEFPFAHHGGAARSMRTIAEMMFKAGHDVHCVATTATERNCDARDILADLHEHRGGYVHRGVFYRIVETGGTTGKWRTAEAEAAFDKAFTAELAFRPDILLTYGGYPRDEARNARAKAQGSKVVIGLRNFGYTVKPSFFESVDGVLTCSQFLTDWYRKQIDLESTPLPVPIALDDVIADKHEPHYFTAINPARRKGSLLLLAIFRELHKRRPDIPLMIVGESNEPEFTELATLARVLPWQTHPKTIYAQTKVLLIPSIWEEPAGRVIAEAMLNGIPPIITDRGGMPETARGGGYIIPLAKRITRDWNQHIPQIVAQPWIDKIIELHDCLEFNEWAPRWAKSSANMYLPENLAPRYVKYFERILAGKQAPDMQSDLRSEKIYAQ